MHARISLEVMLEGHVNANVPLFYNLHYGTHAMLFIIQSKYRMILIVDIMS